MAEECASSFAREGYFKVVAFLTKSNANLIGCPY